MTLKAELGTVLGAVSQTVYETMKHLTKAHLPSPRGHLSDSLWKPGSQGALTYGIITAVSLKDLKMVAGEREREREVYTDN